MAAGQSKVNSWGYEITAIALTNNKPTAAARAHVGGQIGRQHRHLVFIVKQGQRRAPVADLDHASLEKLPADIAAQNQAHQRTAPFRQDAVEARYLLVQAE